MTTRKQIRQVSDRPTAICAFQGVGELHQLPAYDPLKALATGILRVSFTGKENMIKNSYADIRSHSSFVLTFRYYNSPSLDRPAEDDLCT